MSSDLDTREERLAARLSYVRALYPPVDVEKIAKSLAELETKRFPVDIDGLCLDLKKSGTRPKIWINSTLGYHRKRFTLAHEIGHIIIPWHIGSIVDELDTDEKATADEYHRMEGEANRFAAELLMPRSWVLEIISKASHLQGVMRTVTLVADVSAHAAAIRVLQLGVPGYIVARVDDDLVSWVGKTSGTAARLPRRGDHIDAVSMPTYELPEIFTLTRSKYYWWRALKKLKAPPCPDGNWRDVLNGIVLNMPENERNSIKQQVNAIIGMVFSKLPKGSSEDDMYYQLLQNLQNRTDSYYLREALAHSDFLDYALIRIYERARAK